MSQVTYWRLVLLPGFIRRAKLVAEGVYSSRYAVVLSIALRLLSRHKEPKYYFVVARNYIWSIRTVVSLVQRARARVVSVAPICSARRPSPEMDQGGIMATTKDWIGRSVEERDAAAAQMPTNIPVTAAPKDTRMRWLSFLVFFLVAFAWPAYRHQVTIDKLNKMAGINATHKARVAAMHSSIPSDKRFYLPDVRAAWRTHVVASMDEINQSMSEIRAANDGKLESLNQADYDASKKVCTDMLTLLDMLDKAEWVPGVDGSPVIKDGLLKEQVRSEYTIIDADLNALNVADKAADDGFTKQQSEERK
jgi:hypothetical protein